MTALNRRALLRGGLTLGGTLALAGCSTRGASPHSSAAGSATSARPVYTGDLLTVAVAAALENLAVAAYNIVRADMASQRYREVPAAFQAFAATAATHHSAHARACEEVLTSAGRPAVIGAPLSSTAAVLSAVRGARTWREAARSVASLEQAAAATYVAAIGTLTGGAGLQLAATTAPVEAAHAAVLAVLLDDDPVPATYLGSAGAVRASALTL